MSDEGANTKRPTSEADVSAENRGSRDSVTSQGAAGRSPQRPTKDHSVSVRMTSDNLDDLTHVKEELGSASVPEAVRETIRIAATVLRGEQYKASKAQQDALRADVPKAVLVDMRDALRVNAESHSDVAFQFQKIGNNVNQLARVANSGDQVPVEALAGVQRVLERIESQLNRDAQRDGDRAVKMRRVI